MSVKGIVFNIQRFSIHDGPGIRTTVFFKGCPLRCFWCHNPEGIRMKIEIQFYPERCIGCMECINRCEQHAHINEDGEHIYLREKCVICGKCIETCYSNTLELTGRQISVEQVFDEVIKDRSFYETSGGGVTLSGGEPLLQREFARGILEKCKDENLHTAIETVADCGWEYLESILPLVDLVMMDIKHLDPEKHKKATGVPNKTILDNAKNLALTDKPIIFRIPVIPDVNDTFEEVKAIAEFVKELIDIRKNKHNSIDDIKLELLPFHRLASDKYRSLGLSYYAGRLEAPSKEKMEEFKQLIREINVPLAGK